MPIVNQPSRQQLDNLLREHTNAVRTALDNITDLKAYLDSLPANTLTTVGAGFEYSAEDAGYITNAIASLAQLGVVARAGATVTQIDDFFFYSKKIWGINPARR